MRRKRVLAAFLGLAGSWGTAQDPYDEFRVQGLADREGVNVAGVWVLMFTKTAGFRHHSVPTAKEVMTALPKTHGLELPLVASLGIYGIAVSIGALSFLPGDLGGTEAAMILLLTLSGVRTADAGTATILLRLAILWFVVLLGAPIAAGLGRRDVLRAHG